MSYQSACPTTHSLSVCLLPDEPVLCVVVGVLGLALEDEVVEVGAAGDVQDVEDGSPCTHTCSHAVSSPCSPFEDSMLSV